MCKARRARRFFANKLAWRQRFSLREAWAGFAAAIFEQAAALGRPPVKVIPISTAQYPTPAARPANSRLGAGKLARVYGLVLPEWRGASQNCVERLLHEATMESQKS